MTTRPPRVRPPVARAQRGRAAAAAYAESCGSQPDPEPARSCERAGRVATGVRRDILTTIQGAGLGHVGGDLSVTDILVTAYWHALQSTPRSPTTRTATASC